MEESKIADKTHKKENIRYQMQKNPNIPIIILNISGPKEKTIILN